VTYYKSYIFQFISVLFSFLNVKFLLDFLGDTDYATWLIIFSLAGLIYTLDLGIGSTVRNQLAARLAKRSDPTAQVQLVFSYYKLILILAFGFFILSIILSAIYFFGSQHEKFDIRIILIISILIFIDFITRAHHPLFAGLQLPHITNFTLAVIQIVIFLVIFFFLIPIKESIHERLLVGSFLLFGASIIVNGFMVFRLNQIIPLFSTSYSFLNLKINLRRLFFQLKRGLPFFLVQIEFSLIGQIPFYFIYFNFSSQQAVELAIAEKVYAPVIIAATIIMYPLWSTYTHLMHSGNALRVQLLLKRQELTSFAVFPFLMLSIFFYAYIVSFFLNRSIENLIFPFFVVIKIFSIYLNSIYSYFMNGMGILYPQIYVYTVGLIVAIPVLYFGSIHENIYVCLSVAPIILLVAALVQRYIILKNYLKK